MLTWYSLLLKKRTSSRLLYIINNNNKNNMKKTKETQTPKKKLFYTKNECAEILNVSRQCIDNYMKDGLFTYKVFNKLTRIDKASFDNFLENTMRTYKENEDIQQQIMSLNLYYKKKLHSMTNQIKICNHFTDKVTQGFLHNLFVSVARTMENPPSNREIEIVAKLLSTSSVEEVSDEYDISVDQIKYMFLTTIKKLERRGPSYELLYNEHLRALSKIQKQKAHIRLLESENLKERRSNIKMWRNKILNGDTSINELGFSTRTKNALTAAGISSIFDIVIHTKGEILGLKGMGRKSFMEIDREIKKRNLSYSEAPIVRN